MTDLKERIQKLILEFGISPATPVIKFNRILDEEGNSVEATLLQVSKTLNDNHVYNSTINLEYWKFCSYYVNGNPLNKGGDFKIPEARSLNHNDAIRIYTDGIYVPLRKS